MLVRFSSTKTESITMLGDSAIELIKMLGATGAVPGAINADDLPAALNRLRQQLQMQTTSVSPSQQDEDEEKEDRQPQVALATRALPLINLLERADANHVPVMWEAG